MNSPRYPAVMSHSAAASPACMKGKEPALPNRRRGRGLTPPLHSRAVWVGYRARRRRTRRWSRKAGLRFAPLPRSEAGPPRMSRRAQRPGWLRLTCLWLPEVEEWGLSARFT